MLIKPLHKNFIMPTKGSQYSAGYDIYMPEPGRTTDESVIVPLGFSTAIPPGYVALMFPRSGAGVKFGLELNNTCGVIDCDYRGEWKACIRTKGGEPFQWEQGDRVLQFLVIPITHFELIETPILPDTDRGDGGFGSTGK